jgi:hypothetical protein
MKLIERLIARSCNRCEVCDKPLKSRTPAILKLYDKGYGIKQSDDNCLVACEGMAHEFSRLAMSEKVLKIINNHELFLCPYRTTPQKATPQIKAARDTARKTKPTKSNYSSYYFLSKPNPRAPEETRIQNPPPILSKDLKRSHEETPRIGLPSISDVAIEDRIRNWRNDLQLGRLTLQTIHRLLDQAAALNLPNSFVQELTSARNTKNYLTNAVYSVDKDGVVSIKKI